MDERAPLLRPSRDDSAFGRGSGPRSAPGSVSGLAPVPGDLGDHHAQFCHLVGVKPINHPPDQEHSPHSHSLYARAVKRRRNQSCTYAFTAALVNTLLLSQIVLGAALTGLGASNSSRILITIFGALNTIIAGTIAFLKSRGQPLRSRMFRDDLSRIVDEIENSAVMWYGISADAHGYDAIDTDDQVTVRGEVARLTRLYDKAVKTNTMNDPDMYSAGTADSFSAGLRKSLGVTAPGQPAGPNAAPAPSAAPVPGLPAPPPAPLKETDPVDESPASKESEQPRSPPDATSPAPTDGAAPAEKITEGFLADLVSGTPAAAPPKNDKGKDTGSSSSTESGKASPASNPAPDPTVTSATIAADDDPDASPASAARFPKKEESHKSAKTLVEHGGNDES